MVIGPKEKNALRQAAVKLVDSMYDFSPHAILLCGTNSQIAFSLMAESWRKRYPHKELPQHFPVSQAKPQDVKGKRVVLFDEITSSGRSLNAAEKLVTQFRPDKIKKIALHHYPQIKPASYVESGGTSPELLSLHDIGWGMRSEMRSRNKKYAQEARARVVQKRAELRKIASSIKPRKLKDE